MARVIVTERAKRDLRRILSDLNERAGYSVAARYAIDFKAAYRLLLMYLRADRPAQHLALRPALQSCCLISLSTTLRMMR